MRELKGFARVHLLPGQSSNVEFTLTGDSLSFYNLQMQRVVEPGRFEVWVGEDSSGGASAEFELE